MFNSLFRGTSMPILALASGLGLMLAGCGGGSSNLPTPGSGDGGLGGNTGNTGTQIDNNTIVFVSTRDGNPEIYSIKSDGTGAKRLTNNAATDEQPSRTTDGRTIVFSSRRDGDSEIYKMNADGSNLVRLTNDNFAGAPNDTNPVFSPDGSKIVWQSTRAAVVGGQPVRRLYIMDASGANQRPVVLSDINQSSFDGSWNPDSTRLLGFLGNPNDNNNDNNNDRDLAIITPGAGTTAGSASVIRADTRASHARYSSGGARIVLSQGATGAGQLQLLNNDGTSIGAGPSGGVNQTGPSFSPDGNNLAWSATPTTGAGRQLYVGGATTGAVGTAITTNAQGENYDASWTQ